MNEQKSVKQLSNEKCDMIYMVCRSLDIRGIHLNSFSKIKYYANLVNFLFIAEKLRIWSLSGSVSQTLLSK